MNRRIDECLSVRDNELYIEELKATDLGREFGSPLFVLSEEQLRRNARSIRSAFQDAWPEGRVDLLGACKANWGLAVQRILASEGCGCDVYSAPELQIALRSGFEPAKISVNGFPKDPAHIERAVGAGARITIDSVEEVDHIIASATRLGRRASVRLRLRPVVTAFTETSDFCAPDLVPTDVAAQLYKGGLSTEEAIAIAKKVVAAPSLELVGFHQHFGRHHPSPRWWAEQMRAYVREMEAVSSALGGFVPKEIDIGGGWPVPRDPFGRVDLSSALSAAGYLTTRVLEALGKRTRYKVIDRLRHRMSPPPPSPAATIREYAEAMVTALRQELVRARVPIQGTTLQIEPGRSLVGNAGVHLCRVKSLKRRRTPIHQNIAAVDTTKFWRTAAEFERNSDTAIVANKAAAAADEVYDIIGCSCFGDALFFSTHLPRLEPGDTLAILDTGAYQEVSSSNFHAMARPATVLVSKHGAEVVRRAETPEEVLSRDVVPQRLQETEKAARSA